MKYAWQKGLVVGARRRPSQPAVPPPAHLLQALRAPERGPIVGFIFCR